MRSELILSTAKRAADQYCGEPLDLMWTDPPFGTGKKQSGKEGSYFDHSDTDSVRSDIVAWLPHMAENSTVVICCDYRLAPKICVSMMDSDWEYRGEVIWSFGLGRPRTSWWPVRHNNIMTFTQGSARFDSNAIPVEERKAAKPGYGPTKPAGSVWDRTMSNTDPERVGYPNQKPLSIIKPFILAHTMQNDLVLDPFMGSGSTGKAALDLGRRFYGVDSNPQSLQVATKQLGNYLTKCDALYGPLPSDDDNS